MSNGNTHFDANFNEDVVFEAEFKGAINVEIKEILYNTKEYWDSHPELVSANGILYIYSDYKTVDNIVYAGIKVGDDSTLLIDLPFTDEYILDELHQSISSIIAQLNTKADKSTTYTKTEVDSALSSKADKSNTYTKTEVDNALSSKADKSTTYTKTEVDNVLRNKADYSDMVGRFAEVDLKLYSKADKSSTYTKDEVNNALDLKADKSTTYTKTEVDNALSEKANTTDVNSALDTKADKSNTYTKTEVNNALDLKSDKSNTYTKAEVDNIISNLPDPMIFKGSVGINGTITDLPVASASNDGFTYKVITEGTYQGIDAKVGDVFTSNGVEWVLIPSGDDVEDTWREIKVNGITVLNSALSTGAVDFVEGDNIEVIFNSTGNTILIKTKNIYTKTEVDNALNLKSDKSDTYTKTEVNNALSAKADTTDVNAALDLKADKSDTYTKTEVNNALSLKANKSDTYTKTEVDNALSTKADTDGTYEDMTVGTAMKLVATRHTTDTAPYLFRQSGGDNNAYVGTEETDSLVGASAVVNQIVNPNGTEEKTASGSIVSISDAIASPVIDLKANIVATQSGSGNPSPDNVRPISGWNSVDLSVNGVITTINLGNTYYGGVLDVTTGVLTVDKSYRVYNGTENWSEYITFPYHYQVYATGLKRVEKGVISSHFESYNGMSNNNPSVTQAVFAADGNRARFKDTSCADLTAWKAFVAQQYENGTPIQIVFELNNPIEIQLTPTEVNLLVNQSNTIFADSGDVEVKYTAPISEVPTISGHKYYTNINSVVSIQNGTGTAISINDADEDNVHDLTAMFGTAIADYVYSLEQATAGSGIAYLRKYGFFTKDYYPYTANTLQSVNTSKHSMVGRNLFDKTAISDNKRLTTTTGQEESANNYCVSDYIYVKANFTYYIANPQSARCWFYDVNKNPTIYDFLGTSRTFTPTTDGYIRVTIYKALVNVDTYQINIGSAAVSYEPYNKHEYALPNIDLHGLYKLDADNNLYADGDTLEGDGTLTRKYNEYTISSLTTITVGTTSTNVNYAQITSYPEPKIDSENIILAGYIQTNSVPSSGGFVRIAGNRIYIYDDAITSIAIAHSMFDSKKIIYELATPTTEASTGFTNPQVVSKYGTEEYVDNRDFPMPVGHETDYPLDSEMALPVPPVTAGTYNLQLTVDASGNQTYSWAI